MLDLAARTMPVVLLTGARQTGKSTLARLYADAALYPRRWTGTTEDGEPLYIESSGTTIRYATLDAVANLRLAREAPDPFVQQADVMIIDEVEREPDLLLAIKAAVDNHHLATAGSLHPDRVSKPVAAETRPGITRRTGGVHHLVAIHTAGATRIRHRGMPSTEVYRVPQMFSQNEYVEGTPAGTRGGTAVRHFFPADGAYSFRLTFYHENNGLLFGTLQKNEQIELAIDGERVALLDINPRMLVTDELRTSPIRIKAGPRTLSASFLKQAEGPVVDLIMKFETALINIATEGPGVSVLPHLNTLAVSGPFDVTGVGDTPSRRKILTCSPTGKGNTDACATRIISTLARQAYRRPVTSDDVRHLMRLFETGRKAGGDFDAGLRLVIQALLSDPEFVFRAERAPAQIRPGSIYRLTDLEIASRLSYFLWSTSPDDTLLNLAAKRKLTDPAVMGEQVRRMLADSRAESLARNFASQWLHLRNLRDWEPDPRHYPNADRNLMKSMERETELFFMSIVREDRDVHGLADCRLHVCRWASRKALQDSGHRRESIPQSYAG